MITKGSLEPGCNAMLYALSVKILCLSVLGNHYVVDMWMLNIVVGLVITLGGLMGLIVEGCEVSYG